MKRFFFLGLVCFCLNGTVWADELVIAYTGNTYSSLFDCGHCPASVGGSLARRATLLDQLREKNDFFALVDAGNFTAGGILDEFSVSQELDQKRSELYLSVMGKIGYDVLCLGDEDLNFGQKFIQKAVTDNRLNLLSANIKIKKTGDYLIKKYGTARVAFIGLTNPVVARRLGAKSSDYVRALSRILSTLKKKADILVLLSNLGETANKDVAGRFPEINLIIASGNMTTAAAYETVGQTVLCRAAYQGKEVRLIRLTVDKGKVVDWTFDQQPLSTDIAEDDSVKAMLPDCFSDNDCRTAEKGQGHCLKPGSKNAVCQYPEIDPVNVWVITDKSCTSCATGYTEDFLVNTIPGVRFTTVDFRDDQGAALIRKYDLKTLPAFIVALEKNAEVILSRHGSFMERRDDVALINKEMSGIFMYLDRPLLPKRLDLFVDPAVPEFADMVTALDTLRREKEIAVQIHFLETAEGSQITAPTALEEEADRLRAVEMKYPDKFWPYLTRRVSRLSDSWWISSFEELAIDHQTIKACLQGNEFAARLKAEEDLRESLSISHGPAILIDNKMIFQIITIDAQGLLALIEYASSLPR